MKTMKLKTIASGVVLMGVISLAACTKDGDIDPDGNTPGTGNSAYHISEAYLNGVLQHTRTYDNKDRLETITMYDDQGEVIGTSRYIYAPAGLLDQVVNTFNSNDTWVDSYEFDGSKRVSKITSTLNGTTVQTTTYAYANNKVVLTIDTEGGSSVQTHTLDNNGNLISIHTQTHALWILLEFSDFDDKKTFDPIIGYDYYKHNPRQEKETRSTGEVIEKVHEYKYNDAGYVTEDHIKNKGTGETIQLMTYKLIKK